MSPMSRPLEISAFGDATLGWAFACSRMGASHRRASKPCQDAYALWTGSGAGAPCLTIAVADGHGDDRHDLSHFGSTLAVRAAVDELSALHTCYALEGKWTQLKSSFKADFPRRLGRRWRESVLEEQRQRRDALGAASNAEAEEALLIRHGTTLIAALFVGDVLLIGQIGDGGVLLLGDGGEVECPLSNNPFEVGGETDSLGSVEAPRLWRTAALERTGTGLVLLATDGLINAFADDEQWHAFARSLKDRIRDFGVLSVASALPGWLDHYSEKASGDDITLAVAVLKPPLVEARESGASQAVECGQSLALEGPEREDSDRPSTGPGLDQPVIVGDRE
jgi:serine/threonine protein phosphatase PrpC